MNRRAELSEQDRKTIRQLDQSHVQSAICDLEPMLIESVWLNSNNFYSSDVVRRLSRSKRDVVRHGRDLAQYIAASVILHVNDGWSYLGRTISCVLAGDMHRALHLAYYAELRAAMSLLAVGGIGIFDREHYVISGKRTTLKLEGGAGTHAMAWLALEEWSRQPASGDLFSTIIRPEGLSLSDWFENYGGSNVLAPQARDWFGQWGMDLDLASADRKARNKSSYRPDGIPTTWQINPREGLDFVRDMWLLLEPGAASNFDQIDRQILRFAVEKYHFSTTGRNSFNDHKAYNELVNGIVDSKSFQTATDIRLKSFLSRQSASEDSKIFKQSKIAPRELETDAFSVMARSLLLLRIATGAARQLFNQSGLPPGLLDFWWQRLGESRGLWHPGNLPESLTDLWADVRDYLEEVADKESKDPNFFSSFHSFTAGMPGNPNMLTSCERVSLWGLCSA